jgi:hypothetical protein
MPDRTNALGAWLVDKGYARIEKNPQLCWGLSFYIYEITAYENKAFFIKRRWLSL